MRSAFITVDSRWAMMNVVRPAHEPAQGVVNEILRLRVERGGGLVEDQDRRDS